MLFNVAALENDKLESIKQLEQEVGKTLIAFSSYDLDAAQLSEDALGKIKEAEGKLGPRNKLNPPSCAHIQAVLGRFDCAKSSN